MKVDLILNKLWNFFKLKQHKINKLINKNKTIFIDYNKQYFIHYETVSFDPLSLISLLNGNFNRSYKDIEIFFDNIKEPILITADEFFYVSSLITSSLMVEEALETYNKKEHSFIIPSREEATKKMGNLIDKYDVVFDKLDTYQGMKAHLHINKYGIISGVSIINFEDVVCFKTKHVEELSSINEFDILNRSFDKDTLDTSILNSDEFDDSLCIIEYTNDTKISLPVGYKYNIKKCSNLNKFIPKIKQQIDYYLGEPLYKQITKNINYHTYKKSISKYKNILLKLTDEQFATAIQMLSENKNNSLMIEFIKDLRIEHVCDYFSLIDIKPLAKIESVLNTNTNVLISYNNEYTIVDISEKNRNSFVSRPDLIYMINKIKNVYTFLNQKTTDKILHSIFNEIKKSSINLPTITDVVYDGIWETDNGYYLVSKNIKINNNASIQNGVIPSSRFLTLDYENRRVHYRNMIKKIPDNYKPIVKKILECLFIQPQVVKIWVNKEKDARALIGSLTRMSNFIKKVSFNNLKRTSQKILNHNIIICASRDVNVDSEFEIDYEEFLGTKKEHGIEFELKHTASYFIVNYGNFDDEFQLVENCNHLIDDIIFNIFEAYNHKNKLDRVFEDLKT